MKRCPLVLFSLGLAGCANGGGVEHYAVDAVMGSAFRPPKPAALPIAEHAPYLVLGGDFHCHVTPPDDPSHVSRTLEETAELAKKEGLDFVVLTPHVPARFFQHRPIRQAVLDEHRALEREVAALPAGGPVLIPGMEYTDHRFGHVTVAFADLGTVLSALSESDLATRPEAFFDAWTGQGGMLVVNHPLETPIRSSAFSLARADLSWRPLTGDGPVAPEIAEVDRLAEGFEVYNLAVAHLRDRYLIREAGRSSRDVLAALDHKILTEERRMIPIGGTDSHSDHLRATTFVLAESKTEAGIRDGLLAGRVCVRSPAACTFEVKAGGRTLGVGGAAAGVATAELRALGKDVEFIRNGEVVARGKTADLLLDPSVCSVLRANVDGGFSAPIYVNCDFAE